MPDASFSSIKAVILDIEGTVAPITFVKDTLFPYALNALPSFLASNWTDPTFRALHLAHFPEDAQASPAALAAHVRDLTARDVKVAYLKGLQGALWRRGYESGELVTPLFPDVLARLREWRGGDGGGGRKLGVFSSGSVEAQKMFFGHVGGEAGARVDMRPLFEPFWFDTVNAGDKFARVSYEKIVGEMGVGAGEALFLSDHVKEVQAALEAGLKSVLIVRPGNPPQGAADGIATAVSLENINLVG